MYFTSLPFLFWDFALETAAYLLNRVPSKSVSSTPYEIWRGKQPNLKYLKIWDCPSYIKKNFGHKLDTRADKYLFMGYHRDSIGYQFYHPTKQKIFVSRHATFLEEEFILQKESGSSIELGEVQDSQINNSQPTEHINKELDHTTPLRRSERVPCAPERYGFVIENNEAQIIENNEPLTYTEAILIDGKLPWNPK